MANIRLKGLLSEAEDFQARSKETGKLVHFKSKDAYQAALKAGSHEDPKAKKGGQPKGAAKPNDMFGGDYAKDRGGEAPKADSMATVNSIAAKTGLRAQAVAGWADENGVNLSKVSADIDSKKLKPMDFMTAVSGNPGNKYAKDIITKYSQSSSKSKEVSNGNIQSLASYKDFTNFFKDNFDKFDEEDLEYIQDEMGALKYLESDYESGDVDKEEVLVAYEELQDLFKRALSKEAPKADPTAPVDGQTDDELYDALYDMGYDFGEFDSDDFDEEGFADAAMSLGYRYDDKNKVWNHRDDDIEESSTKLTSMIKR